MSNTTTKELIVYGVIEGPTDIFDFPDEFKEACRSGYNWMNLLSATIDDDEDSTRDTYEYFYYSLADALSVVDYFKSNREPLFLEVQV